MRTLKTLAVGAGTAAVWPAYLALAAYAARQAPWPRSVALPSGTALAALALAALAANLNRAAFGPTGGAAGRAGVPADVVRQARHAGLWLIAAAVALLLPVFLIERGYVAPSGRPAAAPTVTRLLVLLFEAVAFAVAARLLRRRSPLRTWVAESPDRFGRLARHPRAVSVVVLGAIAAVAALDARGYSYSSRRLSTGAAGSLAVAAVSWGIYRGLRRLIDDHAWRWIKVGQTIAGRDQPDGSCMPDDLANRLGQISAYFAAGVGVLLGAWVLDVDLALFRFISEQELWSVDGKDTYVLVGDLVKALAVFALCAAAWRHMSTFFAVAVFPRIPDDPGIRFAVVTLCRYAVLGLGLLCGLSAVHLGMEKIGVVLAALGVGLGFGLQEVVSNFVCGIILLLERPIRVGDVVTVAGMTGKVERINIRATTIINGDNQSLIVPNRAFITSDLINWTLKDKVIRVSLRVKVAYGTDPDRVSEVLLALARDDADVLRNPISGALMEEISDSALVFVLHVYVPEPSLAGRVRHRLYRQIQIRFGEAGIEIPVPTQELLFKPLDAPSAFSGPPATPTFLRGDAPAPTPRAPWLTAARPAVLPVEDSHRGVDE